MTNRRSRENINRLCARLRRTAEFRAARIAHPHPEQLSVSYPAAKYTVPLLHSRK